MSVSFGDMCVHLRRIGGWSQAREEKKRKSSLAVLTFARGVLCSKEQNVILYHRNKTEAGMPRPRCCRFIERDPCVRLFKPCGVIMRDLPVVDLPVDGLEAMRLADLEGMTSEQGAELMGVSRHTFGRMLGAGKTGRGGSSGTRSRAAYCAKRKRPVQNLTTFHFQRSTKP